MEPIFSYSGLDITLVELILGLALLLFGALVTIIFARRGQKSVSAEQMQTYLSEMADRQSSLQGRLSQFAEDASAREEKLRTSLDHRLDQVSHKVGQSLSDTQDRNAKSMKDLHERLAIIDRAQKNIETLSGEVTSLQNLLSNKQARGAFGEKAMQDIIENCLPPNAYSFQVTLSNKKRVDALIHLPNNEKDIAVDSKFPMESWRKIDDAVSEIEQHMARKQFKADMLKHIKDIADKYLIPDETQETAILFLPSEAIFAELHTKFVDVVDKAFMSRVMIVSPTTFMATLQTARAIIKDAAMIEHANTIRTVVQKMGNDVGLLDERVAKLQSHFSQAQEDVRKIRISTEKITKNAEKIDNIETSLSSTPTLSDPSNTQ